MFTDEEKRRLLELGDRARDSGDGSVQGGVCPETDCGALWITKGQHLFEEFNHPDGDPDFGGPPITCGQCDKTGKRFLVLDGNVLKLDVRV